MGRGNITGTFKECGPSKTEIAILSAPIVFRLDNRAISSIVIRTELNTRQRKEKYEKALEINHHCRDRSLRCGHSDLDRNGCVGQGNVNCGRVLFEG